MFSTGWKTVFTFGRENFRGTSIAQTFILFECTTSSPPLAFQLTRFLFDVDCHCWFVDGRVIGTAEGWGGSDELTPVFASWSIRSDDDSSDLRVRGGSLTRVV